MGVASVLIGIVLVFEVTG
ncbi:hypothetical protein HRF67_14380, partial [Enterococcus faecalis]|nr:hypothetical protein [Enterococcus faecalis]